MNRAFFLLSIIVLIMVAYFPATRGGLSEMDDVHVMRTYFAHDDWSLAKALTPSGGIYFRPVVGIKDAFNHKVLGGIPRLLHFQNIFVHTASALLIFWICSLALAEYGRRDPVPPFLAALLFGLHPLATESVAWVSGHSDLLATFFVLCSCGMLFKYRQNKQGRYFALMLVLFMCALLSKEVSLAFAPGMILLLSSTSGQMGRDGAGYKKSLLLRVCLLLLGVVGSVAALVKMRGIDELMSHPKMSKTLILLTEHSFESALQFAKSLGFHFSKIFYPWPLSFAITEVADGFIYIGFILFFVCCLLFVSDRSVPVRLFMSGMFFFVPALPVALGFIAWTPFAERYAYTACAFVVMALVVGLYVGWSHKEAVKVAGVSTLCCLLMFFAATTTSRAHLWSDDVAFFADAVEKSPFFYKVRYAYGNALMKDTQYVAAESQYRKALELQALTDDDWKNQFLLYMGVLRTWEKRYLDAKVFFELALTEYEGESLITAYDKLAWVLNRLLIEGVEGDPSVLNAQLMGVNLKLYEFRHDPFYLYSAGKSALAIGDKKTARELFGEAYAKLPEGSLYKPMALKLKNNLK